MLLLEVMIWYVFETKIIMAHPAEQPYKVWIITSPLTLYVLFDCSEKHREMDLMIGQTNV